MGFVTSNLDEFTSVLFSKEPVPGGGGASALVGAVGVSLGAMVGSLTVGKPKFADVEDEVNQLLEKAEVVRKDLLALVDEDAVAFEPLSKAYGIPKEDPTREKVMEDALRVATETPMNIMRTVARAVDILERMGEIGTPIAISDVGCGAVCCKAAMQGASLNVFINTGTMTDRDYAQQIEDEADGLLEKYGALCDEIFASVSGKVRK